MHCKCMLIIEPCYSPIVLYNKLNDMKFTLLLIAFLFYNYNNAQTVKKATRQSWAGGVCCISGVNYNVYLDSKLSIKKVSIHKIWLKNYGLIQGSVSELPNEKNTLIVSFGYKRNQLDKPILDIKRVETRDADVPAFEGMAMVILIVRGKKVYIEVEDFEDLKKAAYP